MGESGFFFGECAGDAAGFSALGTCGAPVAPAVAAGGEEGEVNRAPLAQACDAEGGGEIESRGEDRDGENERAGIIQIAHQQVGDHATEHALNGDAVGPHEVAGQQTDERRSEQEAQEAAEQFRNRRARGPRTQPAPAESANQQRYQERGQAFGLEHEVAEAGAEQADPVVRGTPGQVAAGGVERWIEWSIGDERKEQEEAKGQQKQADQLIQPTVLRRRKDSLNDFHRGA